MSEEIIGEEWRGVPGFPDYQVSSHGRIKSFKLLSPKILKPFRDKDGYLEVSLCSNGVKKTKIHQVVALCFIGPRPDGMEVAHGDGNPANNMVGNLRYATPVQNMADKVLHGTENIGERNGGAKLSREDVLAIRQFLQDGWTQWFVGRLFGVAHQTVSKISRRDKWAKVS